MMNNKFVVFFMFSLFTLSCNISNEIIYCNFSDNIVLAIAGRYSKIEYEIYYSSLIQKYQDFFNLENDLYDYLHEICFSKKYFDRKIFMDKYNLLMNSIPKDIDKLFYKYFEQNNIGYKYFINCNIIAYIYMCESVYKNEIDKEFIDVSFDEVININNIYKLKRLFSNDGKNVFENNKEFMFKKLFLDHNELDHVCG